jgi:hypothetical protein
VAIVRSIDKRLAMQEVPGDYWIDTGWGCGGIVVRGGKVVDGAPIFRKLIGEPIAKLARIYTVRYVGMNVNMQCKEEDK